MSSECRHGRLLGKAAGKPLARVPGKVVATLDPRDGRAHICAFLFQVQKEIMLFGEAYVRVKHAPDNFTQLYELRGRDRPKGPPELAKCIELMTSGKPDIP
jgi:hypothetical protein